MSLGQNFGSPLAAPSVVRHLGDRHKSFFALGFKITCFCHVVVATFSQSGQILFEFKFRFAFEVWIFYNTFSRMFITLFVVGLFCCNIESIKDELLQFLKVEYQVVVLVSSISNFLLIRLLWEISGWVLAAVIWLYWF